MSTIRDPQWINEANALRRAADWFGWAVTAAGVLVIGLCFLMATRMRLSPSLLEWLLLAAWPGGGGVLLIFAGWFIRAGGRVVAANMEILLEVWRELRRRGEENNRE